MSPHPSTRKMIRRMRSDPKKYEVDATNSRNGHGPIFVDYGEGPIRVLWHASGCDCCGRTPNGQPKCIGK